MFVERGVFINALGVPAPWAPGPGTGFPRMVRHHCAIMAS